MPTLREVRSRISGVKKTEKITRAMKMVAAAKLRRAQMAVVSARPYAKGMRRLLQHLLPAVEEGSQPLLTPRPVRTLALIVVTSDRGMCGAFNTNIARAAVQHIKNNYSEMNVSGKLSLVCIGKKGFEFFNRRKYQIAAKHVGVFSALDFAAARTIVSDIVAKYAAGEFDRVEVVYNEFKNAVQQRIVIEQFLPIPADAAETVSSKGLHSLVDYIYEPSGEEIVSALVPKHLNFQLWRILLESNAAEQGARMTAMENASTNAKEMISTLELTYNKARQASITKELLEIVGGAEALKKAG